MAKGWVWVVVMVVACGGGREHAHAHEHAHEDEDEDEDEDEGGYSWKLPPGFPRPVVPDGNPMSAAKVRLGRHLFYDTRLSDNQTQSCASCHKQELSFSDGRRHGVGSTGEVHPRNAMAIVNVAYAASLTWANPLFAIGVEDEPLARQAQLPMFGDAPIELGMRSAEELERRLREEVRYEALFAAAFEGEDEPITAHNATLALASFQRSLISGRSPFDRYQYSGEEAALSESAKRGYQLFFGEKFECFHCHAGFNFTDHVHYEGKAVLERRYHNTGLYDVDGKGAYPQPNTGVFDVTGEARDMGMFKAPSLRNIAVTAPYMHDGSIETLSEVLDHYAAGGRSSGNPRKDTLIRGFSLSERERADVIAFLESLTDEEFLHDPAFADPWLDAAAR